MQLQPLTLNDKPIFDAQAHRTGTRLSHYAFAPLYIWQEHFQFYWTLLADYLCIFAKQGDDYFMPIVPMPLRDRKTAAYLNVICQVYQFMLASNRNPHIARIENVPQKMISFFEEEWVSCHHFKGDRISLRNGDTCRTARRIGTSNNAMHIMPLRARYPSAKLGPYRVCRSGCVYCHFMTDGAKRGRQSPTIRSIMQCSTIHGQRTGLGFHRRRHSD